VTSISHKVFLLELAGSNPIVQYTKGSRRRAIAISRLLNTAVEYSENQAETKISRVLVLAKKEWHSSVSFKYGLVNSKINRGFGTVLVPADYPDKFLHQLDNYILLSAKKNIVAQSELHEFFDILILYETIRSKLSYLADVYQQNSAAANRFWLLLNKFDSAGISARALSWARVFAEHFDVKFLKYSRNSLPLKNRLVLDCHFLTQSIDQTT